MNRLSLILRSLILAGLVVGGAAYYRYTHPIAATIRPVPPAATAPVTRPATMVARQKPARGPATQLLDIVRAKDPKCPTTRRLDEALDLRYAARIVLDDPVHLDNQGNLWITRPDAPEQFNFLKASASGTATHVTRDRVAFVWWSPTDKGLWLPNLVVHDPAGKGYQLVNYDGRRPLPDPHGFRWDRALVLQGVGKAADRIVVPTLTGACAFAFDASADDIAKGYLELIEPNAVDDRTVQLVMDTGGVIAYVTNRAGTKGDKGVARFAPVTKPKDANETPSPPDYKWTVLTGTTGWPDRILHLVPLLDGSVLQIVSAPDDEKEKDRVSFSVNAVAPAAIDTAKVLQLVDQLSATDQDKRDEAFKLLTTYGPGIAPLLEKLIEDQQPEAQIRIRQLLKNRIEPSLGSMSLVDGRMRVVNRLPDGGVIFFAEAGVAIPRDEDTPSYVAPAWLSVRPGRAAELLPNILVGDLSPDKHQVISWGYNDHVVIDPVLGPEWFIGNRLAPLLHKSERRFTKFVGIDSTGRWIFRPFGIDPMQQMISLIQTESLTKGIPVAPAKQPSEAPATAPSTTQTALSPDAVLIVDPHLPDPTPRLPGWLLPASVDKSGWDKRDWPVIYMDIKPDPVPWALTESEWIVIDTKTEKVFVDPADVPAAAPPDAAPASTTRSTTSPTTASTTGPSTTQAAPVDLGPPLLVARDGTRYYDGRQTLKAVRPDHTAVDWPLPEAALGTGKPTLLQTKDGLLFLFNESGRVVRIRPTPDGEQPFEFEAAFTRGIPSDTEIARIWLDPADRICIAHGGNRITVLFPDGRIPPAIAEKMRPEDFPPQDE